MNRTNRRAFLTTAMALGALTPKAGAQGQEPSPPSEAELARWLSERRNWGRWGDDDEKGAINLITPEKRREAAALVQSGRSVSLSRPFRPSQQFIRMLGTGVLDYYGFIYHGYEVTHIDALGHVWNENGLWNGRDPEVEIQTDGAHFGDVANWSEGILTRGVLLDVPRYRQKPWVTLEEPVHGWELEAIATSQGVEPGPGDALLVYSGRDAFEREGGDYRKTPRAGLHASTVKYIRDRDIALLGWDFMEVSSDAYKSQVPIHGVIFSYGVALLDNAHLGDLAVAAAEEKRYEFLLSVQPLRVVRGTGSPVNPTALF